MCSDRGRRTVCPPTLEEPRMWNPPIDLNQAAQKLVTRTRKARKFFVFLREHRHELLDADFQQTLAHS